MAPSLIRKLFLRDGDPFRYALFNAPRSLRSTIRDLGIISDSLLIFHNHCELRNEQIVRRFRILMQQPTANFRSPFTLKTLFVCVTTP